MSPDAKHDHKVSCSTVIMSTLGTWIVIESTPCNGTLRWGSLQPLPLTAFILRCTYDRYPSAIHEKHLQSKPELGRVAIDI